MPVSQSKLTRLTPNLGNLWISLCSFWLCGSIVANPIIYRLVLSPSRYEIRKYLRFASGRLISITGHFFAVKNSVNCVGTWRFRSGKESFGFQKLLEFVWTHVRSIKYFLAVANFANRVNKIRLLRFCLYRNCFELIELFVFFLLV